MLSGAFSAKPMRIPATAVTKRRTRHTISPNDPAKALTEMSVRGLNLFQYATINGGMYQCMECAKDGFEKTFKNKYSFQRHAFLYHEGKQRKVFPCTDVRQEQQYHYQKLLEHHHARQQQELSSIKLLHEEQKRRQHEQDVMRIRSVVNALNLRQLQQMQQQNSQELDLRMAPSTGQQPDVPNHPVQLPTQQPSLPEKANESSVPMAQLIVLNGSIGSQ
uniref:Uncharacterized protein n=1 Tax=Anopheles melas TaxID=34690 RepID=A0A182TEY8_9DIPT